MSAWWVLEALKREPKPGGLTWPSMGFSAEDMAKYKAGEYRNLIVVAGASR